MEYKVGCIYHHYATVLDVLQVLGTTLEGIIGDFYVKVGNDMESNDAVGKFGLGIANERGKELVDICNKNELSIINTLFQ